MGIVNLHSPKPIFCSYEFDPDLVVIHIAQENQWLTAKGHGMLVYLMSILANGKILLVLEEQPDMKSLQYSAQALTNWQPPKISLPSSDTSANFSVLEKAREMAGAQWKCIN